MINAIIAAILSILANTPTWQPVNPCEDVTTLPCVMFDEDVWTLYTSTGDTVIPGDHVRLTGSGGILILM